MQTKMPASTEQSKQNQTVHSPTQLFVEPQAVFEDHRQQSAQLKETQTNMAVSQQQQGLQALQAKMNTGSRIQQLKEQQAHSNQSPKPNNTGLPDNLKSGIENLSGMSMDHVKVHYNSDKPAQLQAHAYAQGSEIHVAPGQEQHVPHEAWHVVQQAQGRVRPTMQMKGAVPVNDDSGLEAEADLMGARALQFKAIMPGREGSDVVMRKQLQQVSGLDNIIVQRAVITVNEDGLIADSAQIVADKSNATAGAFSEVAQTETVYIFAHGYHSLTKPLTSMDQTTNLEPILQGGITAADLCQMMISEGWDEEHTGDIDIRACMSGAESMLPSFAELFATELKNRGRTNKVTGYKHLTSTNADGTEKAMKPTVSKMIDVAQQFDPENIRHQFFAMEVTELFQSKSEAILDHRLKCNKMAGYAERMPALFVGIPPKGVSMSNEEWNIYSYYHAVQEKNYVLMAALKGEFKAKDYQVNKPVGGAHDRQFDPANL
jgi:hypothetical protein